MASPPDHWNPVLINALKLFVGFWGTLQGQLLSFWMALLSSVTWVGNGSGKRLFVTPGHLSDPGGNLGKRVRLTKKTRPCVLSHCNPDPGRPTPRRWKRLRPPSSVGVGGEVGEPRNLFPRLGVG